MKNLSKTLTLTFIILLILIPVVFIVQYKAQKLFTEACLYVDRLDIFAFLFALFLVIEGFYRIFEHPHVTIKHQFTRTLRIGIGFSMILLHTMQALHG